MPTNGVKLFNKKITIIVLTILFLPIILPHSSSDLTKKPTIRVGIIKQQWDPLDKGPFARLSTILIKKCFRKAENKYDIRLRTIELWDDWNSGSIQRGALHYRNIDVIVAPGGVGGWFTPLKYRQKIKRFVRLGGGFYGICGDSTFGSLGVKNLNWKHHRIICKALGYNTLSPMLKLANVYTDASSIKHIIDNPRLFPQLDMIQFLTQLPFSRGIIHCNRLSTTSIQEPYEGKNIRVMLGNAPLVEGSHLRKLIMPPVKTIASFDHADEPYQDSINQKKAMISTRFGFGRVILSPIHAEATIGNKKAHDLFVRNVIWLSGEEQVFT